VTNLASDQPPYSMLSRGVEADVLPYCLENNIGVVVYSPLQRGLLTGKMTAETTFKPGDHRADSPDFAPDNIAKVSAFLDQIRPIADGHNATLAQIVIAWTIQQPGVSAALVGARSRKQALENAAAGDITLTNEETARINALLDEM
jgi:aryl-alcohol dehydrogenase-like predicted oxidoreductase